MITAVGMQLGRTIKNVRCKRVGYSIVIAGSGISSLSGGARLNAPQML